jgi:hypothetical protein
VDERGEEVMQIWMLEILGEDRESHGSKYVLADSTIEGSYLCFLGEEDAIREAAYSYIRCKPVRFVVKGDAQ